LLLRGSVDYADELTPLEDRTAAQSATVQAVQFTSSVGVYIVFKTSRPPWNNVALRQAVARAIPYDSIIKNIYYGTQAERWYTLLPPWFLGATNKYWTYKTDPAAARAAFKSLGGKAVTLTYRAGRGADQEIAILLETALRQAVLNVQLSGLPTERFDAIKHSHVRDFFTAEKTPIIPSSEYHLQQFFLPTGGLNMQQYKSPAYNAILAQLIAATSAGARASRQIHLIEQAQKVLCHDLPQIPLAFTANVAAFSKSLRIRPYVNNTGGNFSPAQLEDA